MIGSLILSYFFHEVQEGNLAYIYTNIHTLKHLLHIFVRVQIQLCKDTSFLAESADICQAAGPLSV